MNKSKKYTAVFDIGKTNKKFFVFSSRLEMVFQQETQFDETADEDGYPCDDIDAISEWMILTLENEVKKGIYHITAVNFSSYGASLVYLDDSGKRLTPLYNYLKPLPEGLLDGFYERYGGKTEFCRKTASPALDMLNSGLQIHRLSKTQPDVMKKVKSILHLPQYLSYLFTGSVTAGYPSIGCHTAMWDFDEMQYHKWITDENIILPEPADSRTDFEITVAGKKMRCGIGIHDSSSSLVPYLQAFGSREFILVSTGTWVINMNPFSTQQLTSEELQKDCLCFLSAEKKQVKSSRIFLGRIHDVNTRMIADYFGEQPEFFMKLAAEDEEAVELIRENRKVFFPDGFPEGFKCDAGILAGFKDSRSAYFQLVFELAKKEADSLALVIEKKRKTAEIFITGGFMKNRLFCRLLACFYRDFRVFTADIHNSTALGAAMLVTSDIAEEDIRIVLEEILPYSL